MTPTDLDDRRDDALDLRLRAAIDEIAAGYRPATTDVDAPLDQAERRPRRWRWSRRTVAAAAASVAVVGAAVWYVDDIPRRSSDSRLANTVAPGFGDNFTVPEVEQPTWAVSTGRLPIGLNDRPNRYELWLHSDELVAARWFVAVGDDRATATITIDEHPPWAWERFEHGATYEAVELDDARVGEPHLDDARVGEPHRVAWRRPDGTVRTVGALGEAADDLSAIVAAAAALDDIADFPQPDGYTEIPYRPFDGWQSAGFWWFGVIETTPDDHQLVLASASVGAEWERIDGGWLSRVEHGGDDVVLEMTGGRSWRAWVEVEDRFVVSLAAPWYVDRDVMANIVDHIAIRRARTIEEQPIQVISRQGELIEAAEPVAGGESRHGRWLAVVDSERELAGDDVRCLAFAGWLHGVSGCTEPGSGALTACANVTRLWVSELIDVNASPQRFAMVTTERIDEDRLPISVERHGETAETIVEESGGLTIVTGELDDGFGPRFAARFVDAQGEELCS